jgi:hypothetical protein
MALTALKKDLSGRGQTQEDVAIFQGNVVAAVNELQTQVTALIADMASRIANHNTLIAKLNLDAGVTDTNYAAATAATTAALAQLTLKTTAG